MSVHFSPATVALVERLIAAIDRIADALEETNQRDEARLTRADHIADLRDEADGTVTYQESPRPSHHVMPELSVPPRYNPPTAAPIKEEEDR